MALVKYGNGVASMSGKVNGNVHARNKAGAYVRSWAKPVNAQTIRQSLVRAAFANQSAGWGNLSSGQRDAWNAAATAVQLLNRLGDPYTPTGRQLFMSCNANLAAAAVTLLTAPPADFTPPAIKDTLTVSGSVTSGAIDTLDLSATGVDTGIVYALDLTPQQPNTRTNFAKQYRRVTSQIAGSASITNLLPYYQPIFGPGGVSDNVVMARLRTIDKANGMSSPAVIMKCVLG